MAGNSLLHRLEPVAAGGYPPKGRTYLEMALLEEIEKALVEGTIAHLVALDRLRDIVGLRQDARVAAALRVVAGTPARRRA